MVDENGTPIQAAPNVLNYTLETSGLEPVQANRFIYKDDFGNVLVDIANEGGIDGVSVQSVSATEFVNSPVAFPIHHTQEI